MKMIHKNIYHRSKKEFNDESENLHRFETLGELVEYIFGYLNY